MLIKTTIILTKQPIMLEEKIQFQYVHPGLKILKHEKWEDSGNTLSPYNFVSK